MKLKTAMGLFALALVPVTMVSAAPFPDEWYFPSSRGGAGLRVLEGREAPELTTSAWEGKATTLKDCRGKVVVLDFWATWCGPCRMAMPVLSNWMKTEMPEGVRVFSVNVWEDNPDGARKYITDNDYAMELVFGNNDLAAAYGVEGIPYICAIDGEGNVRYEEIGFSNALGEKLAVWVQDLGQ